jgi:hypothetical protein
MAAPAALSIPQQYRNAFTLIGKLYSRKNMPSSIEDSRGNFEGLNKAFGQHGAEWLKAMAPPTKAVAKGAAGKKATGKKKSKPAHA